MDTTGTIAALIAHVKSQLQYQSGLAGVLRHLERAYTASIENDRNPTQPN